jgi:hypothetical protein
LERARERSPVPGSNVMREAPPIQLAGACSNPQAGIELHRLTKAAATIKDDHAHRTPSTDRSGALLRPGWVRDLIVGVLAVADCALSPHDVHYRAEIVHGEPISRSSIRNALRSASLERNDLIQRVGYGSYRLRSRP